eukprot:2003147-Prymnesium_polylepis.1
MHDAVVYGAVRAGRALTLASAATLVGYTRSACGGGSRSGERGCKRRERRDRDAAVVRQRPVVCASPPYLLCEGFATHAAYPRQHATVSQRGWSIHASFDVVRKFRKKSFLLRFRDVRPAQVHGAHGCDPWVVRLLIHASSRHEALEHRSRHIRAHVARKRFATECKNEIRAGRAALQILEYVVRHVARRGQQDIVRGAVREAASSEGRPKRTF